MTRRQRYFVRRLDEFDRSAPPGAESEVQVLNSDGQAEIIAYVGRDSNTIIAIVHATEGALPIRSRTIPEPVIEAARRAREGFGQDVDEEGRPVQPSFLPPMQ